MVEAPQYRIGHGFDVHPFVHGRKLWLGGIIIPHEKGLEGHSDADALLHALTDALLGALGWDDIGTWFPNTDPAHRDRESAFFLGEIWSKATAAGWELVNCDAVIMAEQPKLRAHISSMKSRIAEILAVSGDRIGIKATTTEQLGFIGRQEGIAVSAVVLLTRRSH